MCGYQEKLYEHVTKGTLMIYDCTFNQQSEQQTCAENNQQNR